MTLFLLGALTGMLTAFGLVALIDWLAWRAHD